MAKRRVASQQLTNHDASIVLGMINRGDKEHDIAAWFGVNQARIAEVKDGSHGELQMAAAADLPPRGAPGPKGALARYRLGQALDLIKAKGADSLAALEPLLKEAIERYDRNEA